MRVKNGVNSHLAQPELCLHKNDTYDIRGRVLKIVHKHIFIGNGYINSWSINIGLVGIFYKGVIPEAKTVNVIYTESLNFGIGDYIQIYNARQFNKIFQTTVRHTNLISLTQVPSSIY